MREIEASSSNRIKDSGDDADEEAEMELGTTDGILDAFDLVAEIGSDADNDNAVGGNGGWQAGEKHINQLMFDLFQEVEGKECVLYEDTMITIDVQEPSPTQSVDSPSSSHNEILFTYSDNSDQMSLFSLSCRD